MSASPRNLTRVAARNLHLTVRRQRVAYQSSTCLDNAVASNPLGWSHQDAASFLMSKTGSIAQETLLCRAIGATAINRRPLKMGSRHRVLHIPRTTARPYSTEAPKQTPPTTPDFTEPSKSDPAGPSTTIAPLPILPRPLGVPFPPNAREKTWKETQAELMDQERRMKKRKALIKEATRGYFHDYNAMKSDASHGGKTWLGPPLLIREDKALYLPNLKGVNLRREKRNTADLRKEIVEVEGTTNKEEKPLGVVEKQGVLAGRVALVSVLTTRISEEHVNSFVQESLEDWEDDPHFAYVQINHQPNPLKSMLLQLFISSLRRTQKESRWDSYMIMGGEWGELAEPLGISNKHIGYIYLVDQNQKIRWAGCGYADPKSNEAGRLRRSLAVLMKRLKGESEADIQPVSQTPSAA